MPPTCEVSEEQRAMALRAEARDWLRKSGVRDDQLAAPGAFWFGVAENLATFAAQEAQRANERAEGLAVKLETERMRLAGCGVAAMGNSPSTVARRIGRDNPYYSASYGDVCAAVDREIAHRERAEGLAKELEAERAARMAEIESSEAALGMANRMHNTATARVAEMQDRMVAAFGEGTDETMLVAISHEHEARAAELEKQLADKEEQFRLRDSLLEKQTTLRAADLAELARLRALPGGGKPLVYLACPYTHKDRAVRVSRFNAANEAASKLMLGGAYVFSPISHTHPIAEAGGLPLGWDFWEGFDRAYIGHSRKLIVLRIEGWKESTGVRAEIVIAQEAGIPVEYIDPAEGHLAPLPSAQQIPAPAKALAPDPAPQATPEAEGRESEP